MNLALLFSKEVESSVKKNFKSGSEVHKGYGSSKGQGMKQFFFNGKLLVISNIEIPYRIFIKIFSLISNSCHIQM